MENLAHQQLMRELTAPQAWLLLLLPLLLLLVIRYSYNALQSGKKEKQQQQQEVVDDHRLPPSPPGLPLLGHLHLIGSLPHVSLRSLTTKHGVDLMLLRLGAMPVLVVSSPRAAEAVLRTHDHVFASRPSSLAAEVILYGSSDIGMAPYGATWRKARMLVTTHLLTVRRVQLFRRAREEEVGTAMARVMEAAAAGAAVDVGELVGSFLNDLMCRAVMGKSSSCGEGRSKRFQRLVADTSPLVGGFSVEEFFPFLARFGVLGKVVRMRSERVKKRWDELLDTLIDEHESKYKPPMAAAAAAAAAVNDPKGEDDDDNNFIQILLSVREEYDLTREQMKAILVDVFFAGIDTTAAVLEYTFVELIQRPYAMRKLQAEVRSIIVDDEGQEFVREMELNSTNTTYLRAVIKESLRLHPPAPLLVPHFSMASCSVVDGFVVPARVRVLVNAWAIGRDARFWEDAEEFVPERFLAGGSAAHLSFLGSNNFQFLPFGAGRRMCPGINSGMAVVELMLANLVHRFDWELPEGKEARHIDMSEEFGLVVHRKEKLLLVPKLVSA